MYFQEFNLACLLDGSLFSFFSDLKENAEDWYGILQNSQICEQNCYYSGLRKNTSVPLECL